MMYSSSLSLVMIILVSQMIKIDVRMITKKQRMLNNSFEGQMMQKMSNGHTAKEPAAAIPQSQVSFIGTQQANTVSPKTMTQVSVAATRTS